ncbi:transcriptional regulator [Nocardiopsis terrae]|uniref:DNA-binding transcriptional LysR family regulator n=1 Tax=Nocardiopsis terrae TaxID=372655 RepID=A0ABR9HGQ3_9ACTN|nr:LysR substrate-binding domain-containing protein [Nocardiopsis terrae]MBE1458147.1 DNA-binding transcriptional LysR family regulator [Nocardiopsis terrae]GHC81912.1 transcriptional regulator [Nocardiopsis terrae]
MELRHLRHFVAVCEEEHFTRAAEYLGITQSGLSASIRSLERDLDAQLLLRTTRRVAPTPTGRLLLAEAQRILAATDGLRELVTDDHGVRGALSLGTEQCMGVVEAAPLLHWYRERHPHVAINLQQAATGQLLDLVGTGRLDAALVAGPLDAVGGVRLLRITEEPLMLLTAADHPVDGEALPEALGEEEYVDLHPGWGARDCADRAFADFGIARRVALQVNDVYTLLDLVHRRMGVAVVPRPVTRKPQAEGLRSTALPGRTRWRVALAMPGSARPSAATRAFLQLLGEKHPIDDSHL